MIEHVELRALRRQEAGVDDRRAGDRLRRTGRAHQRIRGEHPGGVDEQLAGGRPHDDVVNGLRVDRADAADRADEHGRRAVGLGERAGRLGRRRVRERRVR